MLTPVAQPEAMQGSWMGLSSRPSAEEDPLRQADKYSMRHGFWSIRNALACSLSTYATVNIRQVPITLS